MRFFSVLPFIIPALASPTVYFIRHGEKPDDGNGLSITGVDRAQCLRSVFGASSGYNIGHIMAMTPKSSRSCPDLICVRREPGTDTRCTGGSRKRPYETVLPLAQDLGLDVDTSCDRDDEDCVKDVVDDYSGSGNILICWEHKRLSNLAEALGAEDVDEYPRDRYDLIWTDPPKYTEITHVTSESCAGLDD
ncbi:phosphoglycerate mutase family protein [Geosmithia morbida]|uniref:Phosphoglycerate mutase family protein n=1 Tax=Geosmithia morbida TaxID=1094350 RepID=A0A9P4YRA3_9HYPO|nr:phosphoglycerate mutase family protein [Geosmithia morbida]KAF4120339.1 phosphoglycerate mutase family protein [Geosmithia morbida]